MNLSDQITRIRRYLRDPNAKIWDDEYLLSVYNEIQEDIQRKTKILVNIESIAYPPTYQASYLYDWEYNFLTGDRFHQAFSHYQQSNLVCTHLWEMQMLWGITADVPESGMRATHPWEAVLATPGEEIKLCFPRNFKSCKYMAFDERTISNINLKDLQKRNTAYRDQVGDPQYYYECSRIDKDFVLYPRPQIQTLLQGDGGVMYSDEDTTDLEYGEIVRSTGMTLSQDLGLALDFVKAENNVFLVYEVNPTDLESVLDESDYPEYLRKYIECGVLWRAYGANTDGRIPSLSGYWKQRYDLGIEAIKRFMLLRRKDQDLVLGGASNDLGTHGRHPRLPDTYPDVGVGY